MAKTALPGNHPAAKEAAERAAQAAADAAAPKLAPEQVEDLVALATGAKAGEPFTLGGVTRTREFLRLDAEQDLGDIIIDLAKRAPSLDLADVFMLATRELREATAIILADLDEPDAEPGAVAAARERARQWLTSTRGVTTADMLDVVLAQIGLNRLGALLGKLLTASGLLGAVAVHSHPGT